MSKAIIKNARFKYGLILCSLIVTFCFLIKVEGFDNLGAVRVFLGGYPRRKTILVVTFVVCVSLIQYLNADQIELLIKNNAILLVRYGKPEKLLFQLFENILCQNLFFTILIFVALAISGIMCGLPSFLSRSSEVAELGFRGFLMCILFSLVQVILMIKLDEVNTFMVMLVISVLWAFLSRVDIGIFAIFPVQMSGIKLGLNIVLCMSYIAVGTFFCFKSYQREGNV